MGAKHPRARVGGLETLFHNLRPQTASGTKFRYLFKEIVVDIKEERETRGEFVDIKPCFHRRLNIGNAIGQRESNLLGGSRASFADVVARDRNGVPVRHLICTESKDIG